MLDFRNDFGLQARRLQNNLILEYNILQRITTIIANLTNLMERFTEYEIDLYI